MEMSIDEAMLYMELYKRPLLNSVSDLEKDIKAYDIAIETMRKYQKIQEWFKSYWGIQEQDIMDTIHGKSYDNRWHSVISEKDFEMLVLPQTDGEAIPKDQYEARLKAMAAMLEDLKKEMNPIKECEHQIYGKEHWNFVGKCQDVIQQKINSLKGDKC